MQNRNLITGEHYTNPIWETLQQNKLLVIFQSIMIMKVGELFHSEKTKVKWQPTITRDSELDSCAMMDIVETTGKIWTRSED